MEFFKRSLVIVDLSVILSLVVCGCMLVFNGEYECLKGNVVFLLVNVSG